jgi:CheY-like chemotaxis protein
MTESFVLIVDDDLLDGELMLAALADAEPDARVEIARSGESAWARLEELRVLRKLWTVAMILLDLKLPGMSGLELLKRIRTTTGTRRVPVIILSTSPDLSDVESCYDAGANSYLVKPGAFSELIQLAGRVFRYWTSDNRRPMEDPA